MQWNAIHAGQCTRMQCNAMQCNTIQYNAMSSLVPFDVLSKSCHLSMRMLELLAVLLLHCMAALIGSVSRPCDAQDCALSKIKDELKAAYRTNLKDDTLVLWRRLYQGKLKDANLARGYLMIGDKDVVTVVDETCVGIRAEDGFETMVTKGIRKAKPQVRVSRRARAKVRSKILKRLPARTLHKKPAGAKRYESLSAILKKPASAIRKKPAGGVRKRPAGRGIQGTDMDTRSNGMWLWAAVTVGKGTELFTHGNGLKKFTFRFLPKKSDAINGKPRGYEEIRDTLESRVRKGSIIVSDKWTSTTKAVHALGYRAPPAIDHGVEFRDRETGFHSNDIESENSRLKTWSRERYHRLQLTEDDLHEYAFYVNKGSSVADIMSALVD